MAVDSMTELYQKWPKELKNDGPKQESKPIKIFWLFRIYPLVSKDWNKI